MGFCLHHVPPSQTLHPQTRPYNLRSRGKGSGESLLPTDTTLNPGFPGDQGIGKVPEEWAQVLPTEELKTCIRRR